MSTTLNTGALMPVFGLGTYNSFKSGEVGLAVEAAIKSGYRLIDCARFYDNEPEIGEALQKCFKEGVVKREDVFITSKLWSNKKELSDVISTCQATLRDLQLDYLDLYLVHWPVRIARSVSAHPENQGEAMGYDPDFEAKCWEKMEECFQKGLTKAIGISNFSITKTEQLLKTAKIIPAVNQVECHPYFQQPKLKDYCDSKGIIMQCYYPLGGTNRDEIFKNVVLTEIACKHNATVPQICLAFGIQRGCSVIPKSVTPSRIVENFKSTGIKLEEEDMKWLRGVDKNIRYLPGSLMLGAAIDPQEYLWDTTADETFVIQS